MFVPNLKSFLLICLLLLARIIWMSYRANTNPNPTNNPTTNTNNSQGSGSNPFFNHSLRVAPQRQFTTISQGHFKGSKDTRRLRCYRRQCRNINFQSCQYCSSLTYFTSPLINECLVSDPFLDTYDSDDSSFSDDETCYSQSSGYMMNLYKRSTQTSTDIQIDSLLDEIQQIIVTNENEDKSVSRGLLSSKPFKHQSGPAFLTFPPSSAPNSRSIHPQKRSFSAPNFVPNFAPLESKNHRAKLAKGYENIINKINSLKRK